MRIYDFDNYKDFVRTQIKSYPRRGHGQLLKISKLLGVHSTMLTHILKGDSNFTIEHSLKLCDYFALGKLDREYFVALVQLERAGNHQTRIFFQDQLEVLKKKALNLEERLNTKKVLDENDQAIYYSAWYYSGIRLLSAVTNLGGFESAAEILGIPSSAAARAFRFLISRGLLREEGKFFVPGETHTHVARDSQWVTKHHLNWRLKAIEQLDEVQEADLVYTNAIALSKKDFMKIREELVRFIEKYKAIGDPSPSEELCFLNIDWRHLNLKAQL